MHIQHLLHHQIDKAAWDDCIDHAPNGLVYALSWYLDTVSPGWEAFVVVHEKQYQVCFPVPIRQKWGAKYVMHPFVCQQLGFFCRESLSYTTEELLLDALFARYRYIPQLAFNTQNTQALQAYLDDSIRKKKLGQLHSSIPYTLELALNKPYEILHQDYHRDRKYRLAQARDRNINFVSSDDFEPLIDIFIRGIEPTLPRYVYPHNYEPLRNLFAAVRQHGRYELYYTLDEQGRCTSGCWFVIYRHRIIYLYNAALREVRRENGRTLIIDHVIKKYQNSSYIFDFESPMKESINNFYASFGSQPAFYYQLYVNNLPTWIREAHLAKINLQRAVLKLRYPDRQLPDILLPA